MGGEWAFLSSHREASWDRLAVCKGTLESLSTLTEDQERNTSNWMVNDVKIDSTGSVEEVVFLPLNVGAYTHSLFAVADTVLMMSANHILKAKDTQRFWNR